MKRNKLHRYFSLWFVIIITVYILYPVVSNYFPSLNLNLKIQAITVAAGVFVVALLGLPVVLTSQGRKFADKAVSLLLITIVGMAMISFIGYYFNPLTINVLMIAPLSTIIISVIPVVIYLFGKSKKGESKIRLKNYKEKLINWLAIVYTAGLIFQFLVLIFNWS